LLEQPGAYWTFGDLGARLDTPPPVLGQHSRAVLCEVGIGEEDASELVRLGVVGSDDRH
jgi:hypothetical protein